MRTALISLALTAFGLAATAAMADTLEIEAPYIRATPPNTEVTAGYLRLRNAGDEALQLVAAEADVAAYVELHDHIHEDGVMKMREVESIDVPAGGEAVLEPGGLHLMLFGITEQLEAGRVVDLQLEFSNGERRNVQAEVRHPSSGHGHGAHDHH